MPQYEVSTGLPQLPAGLADKEAGLVSPLYRGLSSVAQQVALLTGVTSYSQSELANIDQLVGLIDQRAQKIFIKATEAIPFGALVHISVADGKFTGQIADASVITKSAHAICNVIGGIAANEFGEVIFMQGRCRGVSGTTVGATYYLSTAGTMQLAAPTAQGVLCQIVAVGLGSAGIYLNIQPVGRVITNILHLGGNTLRLLFSDGSFQNISG